MAMNKKEQAEMDALRRQLALARAWRRTEEVKPDVLPPVERDEKARGFYAFAPHVSLTSLRTEPSWTGCNSHCVGFSGSSQGSMALHSTKALALKAARHCFEEEVAATLAKIDMLIEQESKDEK